MKPHLNQPSRQRGMVLLTTVMLLVAVTVLALAAVSMNSIQTRIATNSADNQIAYQTAEGAINQAENNLIAGTYPSSSFGAGTNGLYVFNPAAAPVWADGTIWTTANATIQAFQGGSSAVSQYIVEKLPPVTKPGQSMKTPIAVYRITARAVGKSGNSPVVLQSTLQVQ